MGLQGAATLVTGDAGPLLVELVRRLDALGARLLPADKSPAETARFLFHVWSPAVPVRPVTPPQPWYEAAVVEPIRAAARLGALEHLCLVRTGEESVPARVLEDALGFLARQARVPFAVLHARRHRALLAEAAAFAATAGLGGRISVGEAG